MLPTLILIPISFILYVNAFVDDDDDDDDNAADVLEKDDIPWQMLKLQLDMDMDMFLDLPLLLMKKNDTWYNKFRKVAHICKTAYHQRLHYANIHFQCYYSGDVFQKIILTWYSEIRLQVKLIEF